MNVEYKELTLSEFELWQNALDATKNIRCVKDKGGVDNYNVIRCLKKFYSANKNVGD